MKEFVRTILDYPVKGVEFRDITSLLKNSKHLKKLLKNSKLLKKLLKNSKLLKKP